jgi:DNA-binding NarL/FixJ family response regulator
MDYHMPTTPDGLLITRDLFFASKITGTAAELGFRIAVEGDAAQGAHLAADPACRCLILDLTTPGLKVPDVLVALPAATRPRVIAFGPHVQAVLLNEAREAGCDEVLPRSQFSATLVDILARAFGAIK